MGFPSGVVLRSVSGLRRVGGEEFWDPNGVGLPLLDTGPGVRGLRLSASFSVGELASSGGRVSDRARISPVLVGLLQGIRDRVGRPVRIDSGFRSWGRNVALYRGRGKRRR